MAGRGRLPPARTAEAVSDLGRMRVQTPQVPCATGIQNSQLPDQGLEHGPCGRVRGPHSAVAQAPFPLGWDLQAYAPLESLVRQHPPPASLNPVIGIGSLFRAQRRDAPLVNELGVQPCSLTD